MHHITTPFGRRSLTPAQIRAQANADGCPREATVEKWAVLRDITAARAALRLSAGRLVVLDALASFHPETALQVGEGAALVVFPSNRALSARAKGLSETALRRHLAALVEAGIVIRRDSPNGKRYARRGEGGVVEQAYGFDLTPLVARAAEFASLADQVRAEARALRVAREQVSLLRRDCAKLIQALAETEGRAGEGEALRARYAAILGALPRGASRADLQTAAAHLEALAADVGKRLIYAQESEESTGTASQNGRHIQNSNPEASDCEQATDSMQKAPASPHAPTPARPQARGEGISIRAAYPLGLVLDACPAVRDYARNGIQTWSDLITTAGLVRAMLGISPHAWDEAREVMGEEAAAVTVAAILQRAEHIAAPGGYLRALVERKRQGTYSLGPVLQALARAPLRARVA